MAEFCLDCWNKLNEEIPLTEKDVIISKNLYLCEKCGKLRNVIAVYERKNLLKRLLGFFLQTILRR